MNKQWSVTVILLFFIFAEGCHLQNEKNNAVDTWIRRMCCDFPGEIILSNIEVNANYINIKFCADTINQVYLSLTNIENPGCKIKVDTSSELVDANLTLRYSNLFKRETSPCFIGEKFRDGNYYLYLATEHGCGAFFFRLLNGKFISDKSICIEKCVDSQY